LKINKFLALILTTLLIASAAFALMNTMPVKAQQGVTIGTAQYTITGGPVPAGVSPSTNIDTISYISFSPNPIGVGQQLLINVWLQPATQVNRAHTGYTLDITKPDGTDIKVGPFNSYTADATAWLTYIPDVAGNYTIQFSFAGDYYPAGYYYQGLLTWTPQSGTIIVSAGTSTNTGFNATQDVYYKPSSTAKYTLEVQQDLVNSWQPSTLPGPGDYWTRPIHPNNREWWVIGGNVPYNEIGGGTGTPGWPDNTNVYSSNYKFIPYVTGPTSAHVVWRQLGALDGIFGGLIDGAYTTAQAPDVDFAGNAFTFGYTGPGNGGNPSIAFAGRLYNSITKPFDGVTQSVWECSDIRTGQVYWDLPNIANKPTYISYAENAPPVPGGLGRTDRTTVSLLYLGSNLVTKYNPITGAIILNASIPSLSSSTLYADPYVLSIQDLGASQGANRYHLINWTLQGLSTNLTAFATTNVISNITYPFSSIGTADFETMIAIQSTSSSPPATGVASDVRIMGVSLTTGNLLWNQSTGIGYPIFSGLGLADHGKYTNRFDDGHFYCWDEQTGKFLWQSEISSLPWGTFGAYQDESAYGLIFYNQYDGIVAYDWNTGKVAWHYQAPLVPFETPYLTNGVGNPDTSTQGQSFFSGSVVADGMVYTYAVEHSPTAPLTRGWNTYAINATTGTLVWKTLGSMIPGVVQDGYLTATNYYDGYMYVFGMGQSATTVSAPLNQITVGQNVAITGTVMDKSPAASQTPKYARDTNVPCVSHDSMGDFMAYLYQQSPIPANLTGVPVSIDAVDPNGNFVHIATSTSDGSTGAFGATWTPTTSGEYRIYATFAGDDSYSYSTASTFATVTAAPTATTTPPTATQAAGVTISDFATFFIAGIVAVIIAIAIVGVLILRKR
jgi:hypothetical protein